MIMPSGTTDLQSFFTGDASFPTERKVGFWKSDTMLDHYASGKSAPVSSLENRGAAQCQSPVSFELHQTFLTRDQKLNNSLGNHRVAEAEREVRKSPTLCRPVGQEPGKRSSLDVQPPSSYVESGKIDRTTTQFENSLFSRSLSQLFSRKGNLSLNNVLYGHSADPIASHFAEEKPGENLEQIEAQTIGNLLPSDDDLFSGMTDKLDKMQFNGRDDTEELDFFNSVGGLDLEDDGSTAQADFGCSGGLSNCQPVFRNGLIAGEHPCGGQPSRTLFVRNINSNIEDSELRAVFEQFGDIRALYTSCKHRGFVMISYYDIRAASNAKEALQDAPLRRRKLDIHYSIPKDNPSENNINQGTLVAFNLDASISNDELHQIFGVYGEIKEIHEASNRSQPKFIEFYDARAAGDALRALNGTDIAGRQIKLEPSLLEGPKSPSQQIPPKIEQDECGVYMKHSNSLKSANYGTPGAVSHGTVISSGIDSGTVQGLQSHTEARFQKSAFHHGISSSFSNRSPSNMPANMSPKPHERVDNRLSHMISSNGNSIEFDGGFRSAARGGSSLPAHHYSWGNSYPTHPSGIMWPNSPSSVNGMSMPHPTARIHGPPRTPPPVLNSVLPVTNHHVGSAPTANPSLWQRRRAFAGESPETGFHPGSLGSLRISNSVHSMDFLSPNMYPRVAGSYLDLPTPPGNVGLQSHHQRSPVFTGRNQIIPLTNSFDSPNERARSRRNEGSMNQTDKKLYELDIDRILHGQDSRTTLMLKNIPNKYTSKMLLAAIDERHRGTYDFLYLPIDFKNKCNVGYAFINMINPSYIIPFYQAFNGKKWEKFNSEKVASLAYARIQGKTALIAHFQNSSLMNEDKRCRPILFNTDGPNAGDQVPFPMGINVRTRPGKPKSITHEETHLGEGSPGLANKEDSSNGDASSSTGKESD